MKHALYFIALLIFYTASLASAQTSEEHEQALLALADDDTNVEAILRKAESYGGKMDYLLYLHSFKQPSEERNQKIQTLLTEIYNAIGFHYFLRNYSPEGPNYDGTSASLFPVLRAGTGNRTLALTYNLLYRIPCAILEKRPDLLEVTAPYWGSSRDGQIPSSGCNNGRGTVKGFPLKQVDRFVASTHLADGNFVRDRQGTIRFKHIRTFMLNREMLKLAPYILLESPTPDIEVPYDKWKYLSLENYSSANKVKNTYTDAIKSLVKFYIAYKGLNQPESYKAAKIGLFNLAFGSNCRDTLPKNSLRMMILNNDDSTKIAKLINSDTLLEWLPAGSFYACSRFAGKDPLIHIATKNAFILDQLLKLNQKSAISIEAQRQKDLEIEVDAINSFGKTALMTAAQINNYKSVKLLIEYGADVNAVTGDGYDDKYSSILEHDHRTPLMYAAANSSLAIIELLIENGASIDMTDSEGLKPLDYLIGAGRIPSNSQLSLDDFEQAIQLLKQ